MNVGVPPHFHKEDRIFETDLIPDGNFVSEVPTWPAPEGTEVSYLNGSDFRRYKMINGAWRQIGSGESFNPFAQFLAMVGWDSKDGWTETIVSGGGVPTVYSSHLYLQTSSGGSNAEIWLSQASNYYNIFETDKPVTVEWIVPDLSVNGGQQDFFLYFGAASVPITTGHHFGFNINNNNIKTSTGDGSNQTLTDTSTSIVPNTNHMYRLRAVANKGTDVKFYVDDVLVATHTTNLPTQKDMRIFIGAKTGNSGGESIRVNRILITKEY